MFDITTNRMLNNFISRKQEAESPSLSFEQRELNLRQFGAGYEAHTGRNLGWGPAPVPLA